VIGETVREALTCTNSDDGDWSVVAVGDALSENVVVPPTDEIGEGETENGELELDLLLLQLKLWDCVGVEPDSGPRDSVAGRIDNEKLLTEADTEGVALDEAEIAKLSVAETGIVVAAKTDMVWETVRVAAVAVADTDTNDDAEATGAEVGTLNDGVIVPLLLPLGDNWGSAMDDGVPLIESVADGLGGRKEAVCVRVEVVDADRDCEGVARPDREEEGVRVVACDAVDDG
jgi:hypothetical protein